jgi:hypothetical protein
MAALSFIDDPLGIVFRTGYLAMADSSSAIDRQISNATRATNGSPVLLEKRQIVIALFCRISINGR